MVESLHVNHNRWAPNLQLHRLLRLLLLLNRWIAQRLTLAVRKRLSSTFPVFVLSLSGQMIVQAHPLPLKRSFVLKDQMAGGGGRVFSYSYLIQGADACEKVPSAAYIWSVPKSAMRIFM
jgi:hypothetical protein